MPCFKTKIEEHEVFYLQIWRAQSVSSAHTRRFSQPSPIEIQFLLLRTFVGIYIAHTQASRHLACSMKCRREVRWNRGVQVELFPEPSHGLCRSIGPTAWSEVTHGVMFSNVQLLVTKRFRRVTEQYVLEITKLIYCNIFDTEKFRDKFDTIILCCELVRENANQNLNTKDYGEGSENTDNGGSACETTSYRKIG